jgi:hypothetical protein
MVDPIRAEELFFAAIELGTTAERAQFLDDACRDAPELRQRVELMLEGHFKAEGFLEPPSAAPSISLPDALGGNGRENDLANRGTRDYVPGASETIGSRIGPYKLLQRLGEGGMGTVYMAEQEQPVKRRVALKIIKTGMDSAQVTARFEQERQALAMMDHPNIAKVLDAGAVGQAFQPASARGRPVRLEHLTYLAGPTSSWSWSKASRSPASAIKSTSRPRSGCSFSCLSARPCSTHIRKGSSTAISSPRTY